MDSKRNDLVMALDVAMERMRRAKGNLKRYDEDTALYAALYKRQQAGESMNDLANEFNLTRPQLLNQLRKIGPVRPERPRQRPAWPVLRVLYGRYRAGETIEELAQEHDLNPGSLRTWLSMGTRRGWS